MSINLLLSKVPKTKSAVCPGSFGNNKQIIENPSPVDVPVQCEVWHFLLCFSSSIGWQYGNHLNNLFSIFSAIPVLVPLLARISRNSVPGNHPV